MAGNCYCIIDTSKFITRELRIQKGQQERENKMNDKLWCQMCGHEQKASETYEMSIVNSVVFDICQVCGARIARHPKPEQGQSEEILLAKLAKRDALIEKLIEAGDKLAATTRFTPAYLTLYVGWKVLSDEWKETR